MTISDSSQQKPRVLIFIVAYNAEKTLREVVRRIPASLADTYEVQVLIIDDASGDETFTEGHHVSRRDGGPFPVRVLFNPVNQGYGGNQKLGYHYAMTNGFDFVALLHGDGQYAPECLPDLIEPLRKGDADAVFGSRMMTRKGARQGGMPLYKFAGNKILTWIENRLLRADLSEFHSGYRVYSVAALRKIPFERNSNKFHFDTEIIIQLLIARQRILELPIPTYYGDEICHVNGMEYAADVVYAAFKARLQELSLFYDRRFDCAPSDTYSPYTLKLDYESPHTMARDVIRPGARVLDLGCAGGYMGEVLRVQKQCAVMGVDISPAKTKLDGFLLHDLNAGVPQLAMGEYDAVLMLDVIEHLQRPEAFLEELRMALAVHPSIELVISTGNIACFITRAMLLTGQFNYGKRGLLDVTHTRLFTIASFQRALRQAGFDIREVRGIPAPYPLAIGNNIASRALLKINHFLIHISRSLFSYQIFIRATPSPSLEFLLSTAERSSEARASLIEA